MNRRLWIATLPATVAGQSPGAGPDPLQHLARELRNLRIELWEDRLERQSDKVDALQRELEHVREQRKRLEEEARAERDEFSPGTRDDGSANYSAAERADLEQAKALALGESIQRFQLQSAAIAERESALRQRLSHENERLRVMRETLGGLRRAF